MESDESELVFCDTFNHEGEEVFEYLICVQYYTNILIDAHVCIHIQNQLHLDLVRFTPPVLIREVRVVPRDQRVHNELEITGSV